MDTQSLVTTHRPYSCSYCPRKFKQNGNWRSHERSHTGEKFHICAICGRTFARRTTCDEHMVTHTGVKSHICERCGKKFARRTLFIDHMRTPTGKKHHICTQITTFIRHRNRHTVIVEAAAARRTSFAMLRPGAQHCMSDNTLQTCTRVPKH
ncbi:hypothetical protein BKA65DRAFT_589458 [Rhexocercosporidium sp. MPI-PUGE-AT-0058]|nr:hypothetical protein BKA65DRAFT_589458 [Rhexocercosporidium sp. MPI-PUGE-AT-0058]